MLLGESSGLRRQWGSVSEGRRRVGHRLALSPRGCRARVGGLGLVVLLCSYALESSLFAVFWAPNFLARWLPGCRQQLLNSAQSRILFPLPPPGHKAEARALLLSGDAGAVAPGAGGT